MQSSHPPFCHFRGRPWIAGVVALLFLSVSLLTSAAAASHHHDHGDAAHPEAGDHCLVCLFAHAKVEPAAAGTVTLPRPVFHTVTLRLAPVAAAVPPAHLLPPGCGPPAHS